MSSGSGERQALVYGYRQDLAEGLVFMPEDRARELEKIWAAVNEAKTWGEFQARVPDAYAAILERWQEDEEDAPSAGKPFEASRIPGLDDGDWPGWPAQEMLDWLPEDIQERYGRVEVSVLNGDYLELPPSQAGEIAAALEAQGYRCREDQELVRRACGW